MKQGELDALKVDFLQWTGGFEPESEADIDVYVSTSMPFKINGRAAREALIEWMREIRSIEIRRDLDQQ